MEIDGESDGVSDVLFPEADAQPELHPLKADSFPVIVPPPPSFSDSLHISDLEEDEKKDHVMKKDDSVRTLKLTVVIAGVIVAVIATLLAVSKKLRQK